MNFIPLNGWPQLKDIPEKLEHFREVYARFAKVNRWYRSIEETELTGNPVIFDKALKLNALELNADLLPIQSGSGDPSPTNVRPISGRTAVNLRRTGKNLLPMTVAGIKAANTSGTWSGNVYTINGVTFTVDTDSDGYVTDIKVKGTTTSGTTFYLVKDIAVPFDGEYIFPTSGNLSNGLCALTYLYSDSTQIDVMNTNITRSVNANLLSVHLYLWNNKTFNDIVYTPMICVSTETDLTPVPYYDTTSLTIALGTTVYGGTLDVKTGVLTITHLLKTCSELTFVKNASIETIDRYWADLSNSKLPTQTEIANIYCSAFKPVSIQDLNTGIPNAVAIHHVSGNPWFSTAKDEYETADAFKTANASVQLCYELATPTTVQLTGAELEMLKGYNYISTDADSLTVKAYTI